MYWGNDHINEYIDFILNNGTEGDDQIAVYNKFGFKGLRKYLMDDIQYHHN